MDAMSYLFPAMNALGGLVLILLISANHELHVRLNSSIRLGLWFGAIGLLAQSLRSFLNASIGEFPFNDLPIWMLKDVGYWLLIIGLIRTWREATNSNASAQKTEVTK